MTPKLLLAAAAALAVAVGLVLPTRHPARTTAYEQIPTMEIGKG